MKIKEAYYYLYYTIYKAWSKNYNPLLSNSFRADICLIALKVWFLGSIYSYFSIILGKEISMSITEPIGLVPFALAIGSTLYFFTFTDKKSTYFEKFEKFPKRKNQIGKLIVWSMVAFIFINSIFSVTLMHNILEK